MRAGLVALLASAHALAAPTFVQAWAGNPTLTLPVPSEAGSVRLVCAALSCGCWGEVPSDSEGNTYTMIGDLGSVIIGCCSYNVRLFYTTVVDAGTGRTTVYGPPGATFGLRQMIVTEYSGLESLTAARGNTGTGVSIVTGPLADAGAGDLLTACAFTELQAASPALELTPRGFTNSGGFFCSAAELVVPDGGSVGASFTGPDGGWVTMAALFKASPPVPFQQYGVGCNCAADPGAGFAGTALAALALGRRLRRRCSK